MIKAVLFDFDGVIIDSKESNIVCFQKAVSHFNYPTPTREVLVPLMGLTVVDTTKKLLPNESLDVIEQINKQVFIESDNCIPYIQLLPGAKPMLAKLKSRYILAVVSNRRHVSVEKILNYLKMQPDFKLIIGKEDVQSPKPHPEGIQMALKELAISPKEAVYVGDSREDLEAAVNAGVPSILVHNQEVDLQPDYRLEKIAGLPDLLKKIDHT